MCALVGAFLPTAADPLCPRMILGPCTRASSRLEKGFRVMDDKKFRNNEKRSDGDAVVLAP